MRYLLIIVLMSNFIWAKPSDDLAKCLKEVIAVEVKCQKAVSIAEQEYYRSLAVALLKVKKSQSTEDDEKILAYIEAFASSRTLADHSGFDEANQSYTMAVNSAYETLKASAADYLFETLRKVVLAARQAEKNHDPQMVKECFLLAKKIREHHYFRKQTRGAGNALKTQKPKLTNIPGIPAHAKVFSVTKDLEIEAVREGQQKPQSVSLSLPVKGSYKQAVLRVYMAPQGGTRSYGHIYLDGPSNLEKIFTWTPDQLEPIPYAAEEMPKDLKPQVIALGDKYQGEGAYKLTLTHTNSRVTMRIFKVELVCF